MAIARYISDFVRKDLQKKMVFIGGPRQCGKTSIAESLLEQHYPGDAGLYLNWDHVEHKKRIIKQAWGDDARLIVFDELHKYRPWKNWLKGLYDTTKKKRTYLVTGSARLDVYRKGGDSLFGRYHHWRLHPFTMDERVAGISVEQSFQRLLTLGGFPEPYLDGNEGEAKRWRKERLDLVLKDDLRDLEQIQNLQGLYLFVETLRERVGNLIVLSNIEQELQISHKTLKRWLGVLENLYILFTVRSHTQSIRRAIQKPFKVFFYDNGDVRGDVGARFENLVATHLLKRCQFLEDRTGDRYEIRFIRDKEKREVDFVIVKERKVIELIEAKWAERNPTSSLNYYAERLRPERAVQLVGELPESYSTGKLHVTRATEDLARPLGTVWR